MLSLFFIHLFITISCLFCGFLVYAYIFKDTAYNNSEYKPLIFYLITGLIAITMLSQVVILFFPLNNYCKYLFLIIIVVLVVINKNKALAFSSHILLKIKESPLIIKALIIVTWGLILFINAGPTQMDDTDSYHIQMVKWIQEYGTVPGIANLHERFGFNSSWFSSIAFFIFSYKQLNYFTALNGVISVWFVIYFFSQIKKKHSAIPDFSIPSIAIFALAFICWPLIRGNAASCNYDFITTLIVLVLFFETFLSSRTFGDHKMNNEWIIWPVYLFTVRILNYPFLIFSISILFILFKQKKMLTAFVAIGFSLLLIVPFLFRNVMLSGYMFFPSMSFDWFAVDWKVDTQKIKELLYYIKYYNRVSTGFQDIHITASLKFPKWVACWYHFMFSYDKLLVIPGLFGILIAPLIRKKLMPPSVFFRNLFYIVIITQLISWFFIAPDPRFVYGPILIGIVILIILITNRFIKSLWGKVNNIFLVFMMSSILVFTIAKIYKENQRNWIFPLNLPQPSIKNIIVGDIQVHVPEKILNNWNPRCFATSLPCVYEIDTRLEPRGKTIANGFRIRK